MKHPRFPLLHSAFLCVSVILIAQLSVLATDSVDQFNIGLAPSEWAATEGVILTAEDGQLRIETSEKSAWVAPRTHWPVPAKVEIIIEAKTLQGNLIGQVEWFDRGGVFIEAGEVCRLEGGQMREAAAAVSPVSGAAQFGLKIWLEGDTIDASVAGLMVRMSRKWKEPTEVGVQVVPAEMEAEVDPGLDVRSEGSTWLLTLKDDAKSAAIHLPERVDAEGSDRIMVPILELSPDTFVSVQLLCWDSEGTFLGEVKVLSDLAEAGDYEVAPGLGAPELLPGTDKVSVKVWYSGKPSSRARIGGILFGMPVAD